MADRDESSTPLPTTETAAANASNTTLTQDQFNAMREMLDEIYDFRLEDGYDPTKLFQRKVNKRTVPDYYDVIKEPMALSTIKAKLAQREYKSMAEFVRDWRLISYNAQVYNLPRSSAYQDALALKGKVAKELATLVAKGILTEEEAKEPYIGELPEHGDVPLEREEYEDAEEEAEGEASEGEAEAEDDEDDDDEELDDSDDEEGARRRRRSRKSKSGRRVKQGNNEDDDDANARKKRGRPPRVDTPTEARIKEILRGMRRFKNHENQLMIYHFERLPDKAAMPEYYAEVKQPIALDTMKKKLKRKKYANVDAFMKDMDLMFENAKSYNTDESQVYQDAVELQSETKKIAEEVKQKPDNDYIMEDGRIPMPDGIPHNGELWKVGDWVHLQNANDLTKPIVAQIYRTWQDTEGNKWVNACWYYRPEQTVHRFDRHFYESEVVKTGQYRDCPIDEVVDRCFVMFITRWGKGRPRNFSSDKEIYVCEARYNEEKHKFNKIKTWASCLPDEVRDKDYEMDLFDAPKKLKKVPSPIKYLFKEGEQKETDPLPKPVWGAPNAPPKIGAVHCQPRDPKDSPPPEPTPSPPPAPPPAPMREPSSSSVATGANTYLNGHRPPNIQVPGANLGTPMATSTPSLHSASQQYGTFNHSQYQHTAPSPGSMLQAMPTSASQYRGSQTPLTPASSHHHAPAVPAAPSYSSQPSYQAPQQHQQHQQHPPRQPLQAPPMRYEAKLDPDVYYLPDHANNSIPPDIRAQFQTDEQGRVLFFTAPPVDLKRKRDKLQHTARYLAAKAAREEKLREKRKREAEDAERQIAEAKKTRVQELAAVERERESFEAVRLALDTLQDQLADGAVAQYRSLFGDGWHAAMEMDLNALETEQERRAAERARRSALEREKREDGRRSLAVRGLGPALEFDVVD